MRTTRLACVGILVAATLAAMAATASAQAYGPPPSGPPPGYGPPPGPPPGMHRSGFIAGFSLGAGSIAADDCNQCDALGGLGLAFHLGGMITPTFALMFDGSGVGHPIDESEGGGTLTHVLVTVAAQVWLGDRLWLKGGIGSGQLGLSDRDGNQVATSEDGFGAFGAVGYEVLWAGNFALDLQLRAASVKYEDITLVNGYALVGVNWY